MASKAKDPRGHHTNRPWHRLPACPCEPKKTLGSEGPLNKGRYAIYACSTYDRKDGTGDHGPEQVPFGSTRVLHPRASSELKWIANNDGRDGTQQGSEEYEARTGRREPVGLIDQGKSKEETVKSRRQIRISALTRSSRCWFTDK
jgi:hypothetical protein